jgi:hypothetical protein
MEDGDRYRADQMEISELEVVHPQEMRLQPRLAFLGFPLFSGDMTGE